ncbi:MAG: hypothetical protein WCK39_05730 [Methanomassiliicoccales archaeon]
MEGIDLKLERIGLDLHGFRTELAAARPEQSSIASSIRCSRCASTR